MKAKAATLCGKQTHKIKINSYILIKIFAIQVQKYNYVVPPSGYFSPFYIEYNLSKVYLFNLIRAQKPTNFHKFLIKTKPINNL